MNDVVLDEAVCKCWLGETVNALELDVIGSFVNLLEKSNSGDRVRVMVNSWVELKLLLED